MKLKAGKYQQNWWSSSKTDQELKKKKTQITSTNKMSGNITTDPMDIKKIQGFPGLLVVKNSSANEGDVRDSGLILGWEDLLEEMATHSSILAWRIHGQRSLAGYNPWGHKQSDTTEWQTLFNVSWFSNSETALLHPCNGPYTVMTLKKIFFYPMF